MGKKKVLIVGKLPPPYIGPAVATKIILESKLNEEYELVHLNTTINKSVDEFGKVGLGKTFKNLSVYFQLFKLLRKNKVDVILIPISQTTIGFIKDAGFILISALFSAKILLQLRGSNFKNWMASSTSLTKNFVCFCMKRAEGMIVLGNNLRHLFTGYIPDEKIYVVPNGCDIHIPQSEVKDAKLRILYFANFLPSKGIKELVEAIVILKNAQFDLRNIEINAVGAWDNDVYKQECLDLLEKHRLDINFHSPKSGDEKWKFFADADIFVFTPNKPEGHPWVIVEALSAGLPIISTDQGAIIESVIESSNGFIVEGNAPEQIADRLKRLIENEALRKEMSLKSRKHYEQNFTEEKMVEKLSGVFQNLLSK